MKSMLCIAATTLALSASAWSHETAHAIQVQEPAAPVSKTLDKHTREDIDHHRAMARAHEEAAQCLEQGKPHADCQKQLQTSCKGLALGKNCGMRHSH